MLHKRMDVSALPNNDHPQRFLQLDVGMLPATHGMFQVRAAMSSHRHWHNRIYEQRDPCGLQDSHPRPSPPAEVHGAPPPVEFVERYLEHITPVTFKPNIKTNPLYTDTKIAEPEHERCKPSWTVQEYDRHTLHGNLADYMKEEENSPKELNFWLEELYTPGFDSLLKKKEAEFMKKKLCKILTIVSLCICVIVVITVSVVMTKRAG